MITSAGLILRSYSYTCILSASAATFVSGCAYAPPFWRVDVTKDCLLQKFLWLRGSNSSTFMSISSSLRLVGQEVCVKLLTPKVSFCSLGRPMQFNTLICMFPCNRWDEIDAEAASQHQEKLARAGKHPSQGVIFFGLPS